METRSAKPMRPLLETGASRFMMLERAVEEEHRPHMLADLQRRVEALAETAQTHLPGCSRCGQPMRCQDTRPVSWWARFGQLRAEVSRYRCPACHWECRPLLDLLGVEPGRISGSLARYSEALSVYYADCRSETKSPGSAPSAVVL